MPKTAMDKNAEVPAPKDKIGFAWQVFSVQAKPHPQSMDSPAHSHLRRSTLALIGLHYPLAGIFRKSIHLSRLNLTFHNLQTHTYVR